MFLEAVIALPVLLVLLLGALQTLLLLDAAARIEAAADSAARAWLSWADVGAAEAAMQRAWAAAAWVLLPNAPRAPQGAALALNVGSSSWTRRAQAIPVVSGVVHQVEATVGDALTAVGRLTRVPLAGPIADLLLRMPWTSQQLEVAACREPERPGGKVRLARIEVRWRVPLLVPLVSRWVSEPRGEARPWQSDRLIRWPVHELSPQLLDAVGRVGRATWPLLQRLPQRTIVRATHLAVQSGSPADRMLAPCAA